MFRTFARLRAAQRVTHFRNASHVLPALPIVAPAPCGWIEPARIQCEKPGSHGSPGRDAVKIASQFTGWRPRTPRHHPVPTGTAGTNQTCIPTQTPRSIVPHGTGILWETSAAPALKHGAIFTHPGRDEFTTKDRDKKTGSMCDALRKCVARAETLLFRILTNSATNLAKAASLRKVGRKFIEHRGARGRLLCKRPHPSEYS